MIQPFFEKDNFILYLGDVFEVLEQFEDEKFALIFADPPYFLSNDGIKTIAIGKVNDLFNYRGIQVKEKI